MCARSLAGLLCAVALSAGGPDAFAHDTWFEAVAPGRDAEGALALGTGNRFPVTETAIDTRHFTRSGCLDPQGTQRRFELLRYTDRVTLLHVGAADPPPVACFVQLEPFEIELPPDTVTAYFREIRPHADVQRAWAEQRARGEPFRERYVKSARIELDAAGAALPVGTAMDVVRTAPAGPPAVGAEAVFQVLRDGQPLAGFPVELVNERSPVGLWTRTDVDGRVRARLPLPGRWLLRGTDLRRSQADPARWESRFVTYAFDVH